MRILKLPITKGLPIFLVLILSFVLFSGCKSSRNDTEKQSSDIENLDTLSTIIKFENAIFPIPSPWQVMNLIKTNNIDFIENTLNTPDAYSRYNTSFKQALNLGVYGTDMGYLNLYEKTQESIKFLNSIKKLSEQLGIDQQFDNKFFNRIENNINTQDSLIRIFASAYSDADFYLKTNERDDIGALIITGGWIESLYILCKIAIQTNNREIINRIGEQKHPLDNLIDLLTPYYYRSELYSSLIDELIDIAYEFDGVIYSYSYKDPIVDQANKLITINSTSRVVMSEYHIQIIDKKIETLRKQIVE
ncbi:MAG: hypothetical protein H6537_00315 [Bacteroidales bacterium]|nr:hypothetical protein [Bacteroidales bacterium]HPD94563.1 hypothetical protein [Tenuifilaceae bacterium]HRX31185.1 hypothetical protein [Tenuifilaceae bacterium]